MGYRQGQRVRGVVTYEQVTGSQHGPTDNGLVFLQNDLGGRKIKNLVIGDATNRGGSGNVPLIINRQRHRSGSDLRELGIVRGSDELFFLTLVAVPHREGGGRDEGVKRFENGKDGDGAFHEGELLRHFEGRGEGDVPG